MESPISIVYDRTRRLEVFRENNLWDWRIVDRATGEVQTVGGCNLISYVDAVFSATRAWSLREKKGRAGFIGWFAGVIWKGSRFPGVRTRKPKHG